MVQNVEIKPLESFLRTNTDKLCFITESVPMRLRALPQSFWKQPNVPNPVSPAPLLPSLPPLGSKDSSEDISGELYFCTLKLNIM